MSSIAFFSRDDDRLIPTRFAASLWAPGTLNGPAVCAVAARAAEEEFSATGFRPARFTIDLFKVARDAPTSTRARLIRDGGRIKVVEVDVLQSDDDSAPVTVARSTTVFVKESDNPPGERWSRPAESIRFRPPDSDPDDHYPWYGAAGPDGEITWSQDMGSHQDGRRKWLWTRAVSTVAGEEPSPFERAAISGESTSLVCNWGSAGIAFINCDLTVALSRLPVGSRIGVEAAAHVEVDGISTSTTNLYDLDGQFGVGMVTGVNNAAATIDFTAVDTGGRYTEA
ncbi:thioesterase family protein [Gordonia sp. ABSL11-1]|uniref:acyl-CoA thioesterase domain-containing protein n=1 Tax=Gordonia sp. ABSL11-1 TaxID=3053924 RepID=UPI002573AD62|nr:acyl-CoA thioesterase domain-containing protein [Gordonia sp. ABSL11-1]MDL9946639.1 thioesterase family protein [Gordonia sp. ABSL11-1]